MTGRRYNQLNYRPEAVLLQRVRKMVDDDMNVNKEEQKKRVVPFRGFS